ncbi:lysosomal membrane ascorbate-dependent ferrireductase CYB561A3 isoform X3 [Candoia aspera]|uniref:lysosomal membrane ascorbate-dependent ferrireductase CYB561A3 isoform X3 n=1 Tax=Candoia aspera TaxID=51853 RepID=UPI002FD85C74
MSEGDDNSFKGAVEDWNYFSRQSLRLRRKRGMLPGSSGMPTVPFLSFSILVGILGILCLGLTVYWSQHWLGGFAWDGSHKMFNWHPALMVAGMLVLYGTAALVYRLPFSQTGPKFPWKVLHATLTLVAFVLVVLGLEAVFEFHSVQKIPNMYSLHSWLGLSAVLLFSCQKKFNNAILQASCRGLACKHSGNADCGVWSVSVVGSCHTRMEMSRCEFTRHARASVTGSQMKS